MVRRLLMLAVSALLCAACDSGPLFPTRAGSTLRVTYESQAAPIDPLAAGCFHHNAPSNYTVRTDWGASVRLREEAAGHYSGLLRDVRPGDHWIAVTDINLCRADESAPPIATRGVSLNDVPLHRVADINGTPALSFSITEDGRLQP